MLATSKRVAEMPAGWIAEAKLDGWRAIVVVADGRVKVRSRRGTDLTDRLPEMAALRDAVPDRTVLDGELIAGEGRASDFYALGPRLLSKSPAAKQRWSSVAISFQAFDVLRSAGKEMCRAPWCDRRAALDDLRLTGTAWGTIPVLYADLATDLDDALTACSELDLEGLVLKRCMSIYRPGERSKDWIKVKTADWRDRHGSQRHEH
jgi:bifunctional non-homologous end joining protein LigD